MKLKRELVPELPETIEIPEDEETLIDGWVEEIVKGDGRARDERKKKDWAKIRLNAQKLAQLHLEDVKPKANTSLPQEMKEILAPYDRIKVIVKKRTEPLEVAYSMENEVQVGEVNWVIITEGDHFYEPDEIQGDRNPCPTCGRPRQRKPVPKLKPNLFTEFAERIAVISHVTEPKLTMNQLRNFYDVVKATQGKLVQEPTSEKREDLFRIEKPRLKLLFSKVAHARRRDKIPNVFAKFMDECLKIVTAEESEYEDFEAFVLTFEAVAGYFGKD